MELKKIVKRMVDALEPPAFERKVVKNWRWTCMKKEKFDGVLYMVSGPAKMFHVLGAGSDSKE